jgi:hypothetical protein
MSESSGWLDRLFGEDRGGTVRLQPIAMVRPSRDCIYVPSRIRPVREVSEKEFLKRYAHTPRAMLVSFEADGVSNPQRVTAYGFGLDCWYIVSE